MIIEGKMMPQSILMEEAVLGGILVDKDGFSESRIHLESSDFYKTQHEYIYQACESLYNENKPIELLSVHEELKRLELLEQAGGLDCLVDLTNKVASSKNIAHHASIVQTMSLKRKCIVAGTNLVVKGYDEGAGYSETMSEHNLELMNISNRLDAGILQSNFAIIKEVEDDMAHSKLNSGMAGIPMTGIYLFDQMTNGAKEDNLIIIASRPGMGKSAFVCTSVNFMIDRGYKPVVWSLEMSNKEIMRRLIANRSGIDSLEILKGNIPDKVRPIYSKAVHGLKESKAILIDKVGVTVMDMKAQITSLKRKNKCDILFVDHGGLLDESTPGRSRNDSIGFITKQLKQMAKQLHIPIVCLWQLSREVERRGGSFRPRLSDLRDSGNIEQDADVVTFLYRPEYYCKLLGQSLDGETMPVRVELDNGTYRTDHVDIKGKGLFVVAKNRDGRVGDVPVEFIDYTSTFKELKSFDF